MALSRPFREDHPALPLSTPVSPPGDRRCDDLGFAPAGRMALCQAEQQTGFQARSKDQEILEEGGGAGPST